MVGPGLEALPASNMHRSRILGIHGVSCTAWPCIVPTPLPPSPSLRNRYTEADFNSSLTERQQSGSCKQIREAWISGEAILFVNLLSSGYKFNEGVSVLLTRERKICRFVNLLLIIEHYWLSADTRCNRMLSCDWKKNITKKFFKKLSFKLIIT